ncbi:MAG: hypothetical protein KGL39_52445 [Patescibacteria group bacterium]|nr:hypothetical protein [Patescibacteria group bacterium]
MTTEYQDLINIGAGTVLTVIGWFAKTLWDAVQELKKDLAALRTEVAKDYVAREEFRDFAKELREMFHTINDKLDRKADK